MSHLQAYVVWRKKTFWRKVLQGTHTLITALIVGVSLSYVVLTAMWWVLGAILNPSKYLPMAAGAVTLVTFIVSQYKRLNKLFDDAVDYATKSIADKLARTADAARQRYSEVSMCFARVCACVRACVCRRDQTTLIFIPLGPFPIHRSRQSRH